MPPWHRARCGGDSDAPRGTVPNRGGVLDAPFGTMLGAEGISPWLPASGNGDPAAQVQAQGSSGTKDQTRPLPMPALHSEGRRGGEKHKSRLVRLHDGDP